MKHHINRILQRIYYISIIGVMSLFLFACAHQPGSQAPPGTRGGGNGTPPSLHAWDLLTEMDSEKDGFAMYTYVLLGRRLDFPASIDSATKERYKSLLNTIVVSTLRTSEIGKLPEEETNLFYIPAIAAGKKPSLNNYNAVLAMRYIIMLSKMVKYENPKLADLLTDRPGPFLISTLMPIGKIGKDQTDLLYTDLSTTNPAAMAEIVAAYKRRISSKSVNKVEHFWPLRLALLNIVLNADDNVKLVKVAMAEWLPE